MGSSPPIVRIVVLDDAPDASSRRGGLAPDTGRALARIGAQVELRAVGDVPALCDLAERSEIDLVVIDRCSGVLGAQALDVMADSATPVIAILDARADDAAALDAFRRGVADCVRVAQDYEDVLPVVALEQIRRWRQQREREAVREKIEWLERLQKAIISEIPVSLLVIDPDGSVVDVNPEFSAAFSISAKQAAGMPAMDLLPSDLLDTGALEELITGTFSGAGHGGSRLARHRDGAGVDRVFDVRGQRLDDAGRVLLVLADVTQTELLTRRLGELEHYNDNIIQNINSALLVVDRAGHITFANPRAGEILGVDSASLTSRPVWDWFGDADEPGSLLGRTLSSGSRFKGAETMITLDSGGVIPVGISATPLLDDAGTIRGAVAIFQDLSEIKQLERQVLQTEKMASIGQLAAGVAHEINNPMGFIHANLFQMTEYLQELEPYWQHVKGLQEAVATGDMEAARQLSASLDAYEREIDVDFIRTDFAKAVRESQEGSNRIRHIVRDLREFSHQGASERALADLNQCVDSTASIVWTMMKHSVVLEKEYEDIPQIHCFPMQLKQVFMNLLVNAYQAIEEAIADSGDTGVIRIVTARKSEGILVAISDTGVGIPKENLQRIFDPFFTTKEVGAGTGLGLSTTYGIVERHGGTMNVTSAPGEGTTFEIWLPLEPPAESMAESSAEHEAGRRTEP